MLTDNDGEMIIRVDHDGRGGIEIVPDTSALGWWVRERDYHRYITAKSMAAVCYAELVMRKSE